jgi:hypothetical protein
MLSFGEMPLDVHRFAEMFMLGFETKVGIWESRSPPTMYNSLRERVASVTVLGHRSESIEKAKNVKLLSFDEVEKKRPRPQLDVWVVFDPDNMGMPNFLPEYAHLSLKRNGRVMLIRRRSLAPTLQVATLNAMFTNEGFEHIGTIELNPCLSCEVFYKKARR